MSSASAAGGGRIADKAAATASDIVGGGRLVGKGGVLVARRGGGPARGGGREVYGDAVRLALELLEEEEEVDGEEEEVGVGGVASEDRDAEADLDCVTSLETPLLLLLMADSWRESLLLLIWLMKDSRMSRVREKREEESLVRLLVSVFSMLLLLMESLESEAESLLPPWSSLMTEAILPPCRKLVLLSGGRANCLLPRLILTQSYSSQYIVLYLL